MSTEFVRPYMTDPMAVAILRRYETLRNAHARKRVPLAKVSEELVLLSTAPWLVENRVLCERLAKQAAREVAGEEVSGQSAAA